MTAVDRARAVQFFSDEYLLQCKSVSLNDRLKFLEEMRMLALSTQSDPSIPISLRMGRGLLGAFKARCQQEGIPYQTKIKELIRQYLFG